MNNVIICGLGAVGLTYAVKLTGKCNLKVLVDTGRLQMLIKEPPFFNNVQYKFEYILPSESFSADLVIIATKSDGLESALAYLKNFVTHKTHIISLMNGISSEEKISKAFPEANVIKSYFIGHSAVRTGNRVTQDGVGKIVIEKNSVLENFFKTVGIDYYMPNDINYSMWLKFTLNLFSNQTSAILGWTFGDMKNNKHFINFAKKIISEVKSIAQEMGINGLENLETDSFNALSIMCNDGKTSMLQDILSGRATEVDIFSGEIIRLGKKFGIPTPYNQVLYDLIKMKEEYNEYCIHSGKGRQ